MALRCFLFSEDENTAAPIRQILDGLGVEAESCSDAVAAAEKITNQTFQIVVIDWDKQPEAGVMLNTARERKAAERPLTLAVVSDDKAVPGVLQAGANSILRKPIVLSQATDTLKMARDLIRAKQDSAAGTTHAVAAAAASAARTALPSTEQAEKLRAGEFLQSAPPKPGGQFETEADVSPSVELASIQPVDALKELEPVASVVSDDETEPAPAPPTPSGEARGLEWYKNRLASLQPKPEPTLAPPPPPRANPGAEMLSYDQTPSLSAPRTNSEPSAADDAPSVSKPRAANTDDRVKEAELFAYIDGGRSDSDEATASRFHLGKKAIIAAAVLAGIAIALAPQAPWHPKLQGLYLSGRQSMHTWLNPQPVTPVQAPAAHENFAQAGDEYKLPTAEPIPDATTDPSQIQVVPVVDPTAKKPNNNEPVGLDQPNAVATVPTQSPAQAPGDPSTTPTVQAPETQPVQNTTTATAQPGGTPTVVPVSSPAPAVVAPEPSHTETPAVAAPVTPTPAPKTPPRPPSMPEHVPSSLKSQMAPATEAGGNKPVDAAMPTIEPVQVTESAERALLAESPAISYPDSAKGQQGTVLLQVLVARDGTVQDVKFLQGSLAFARAAIDGVKQWKFKPYMMNGRPVSVQTQLTMKFNPGQ